MSSRQTVLLLAVGIFPAVTLAQDDVPIPQPPVVRAPAPVVDSTAHRHLGFFVHLDLGAGYFYGSAGTETTVSISGPAAPLDVAIGGAVTENWILAGEVYITQKLGEKYKVLATLGAGELIGEMSFFDKSVRSATVIAKGDVHALEFTRENFADIYAASPMWTRRLLVSLARRIRGMVERLGQF